MTYLFDTNVWIRILKGRDRSLLDRVTLCKHDEIAICSIVRAELFHGAEKYEIPEARKSQLTRMLAMYRTLPFDDRCADLYGSIRHDLEERHCVIGPMDLQIACIAMVHDLVLVTGNIGEFSRVRGLKLEDWAAGSM